MNTQSLSTIFKRIASYTWQNMTRNKLLSLATLLVIVLIAFFVNILGSIDYLARYSIDSINKKVDLTLELNEHIDLGSPEVNRLKSELEQNGLTVIKISKEQALEEFKQILPDLGAFLETYRQNPLPASLYVTAKSIQDYEKVGVIVEKPEYKTLLNFEKSETDNSFQDQRDRINRILDIAKGAQRFVLLFQLVFFVVAIIIILNTIQIVVFHRQNEIRIMKLVGASKSFISAPFIIEGILYGVIGTVVGVMLYMVLLNVINSQINQFLPSVYLRSFATSLWDYYKNNAGSLLGQQISVFLVIGAASSTIALMRFMSFFFLPQIIAARFRQE